MTPSPEQIKAAMPAMREWCAREVEASLLLGPLDRARSAAWWREQASEREVRVQVNRRYPRISGVAQFIKDQEERRG